MEPQRGFWKGLLNMDLYSPRSVLSFGDQQAVYSAALATAGRKSHRQIGDRHFGCSFVLIPTGLPDPEITFDRSALEKTKQT